MWGAIVEGITALTFLYCFALGAGVLAAYRGMVSPPVVADAGPYLLSFGVIFVLVTIVLRHGIAHWLFKGGRYAACIAYAVPRVQNTALVGRTEAARNRIAAAESYLKTDRPTEALQLLRGTGKPPSSLELRHMLKACEAEALMRLGDVTKAETIAATLKGRAKGRAKARLAEVVAMLSAKRDEL